MKNRCSEANTYDTYERLRLFVNGHHRIPFVIKGSDRGVDVGGAGFFFWRDGHWDTFDFENVLVNVGIRSAMMSFKSPNLFSFEENNKRRDGELIKSWCTTPLHLYVNTTGDEQLFVIDIGMESKDYMCGTEYYEEIPKRLRPYFTEKDIERSVVRIAFREPELLIDNSHKDSAYKDLLEVIDAIIPKCNVTLPSKFTYDMSETFAYAQRVGIGAYEPFDIDLLRNKKVTKEQPNVQNVSDFKEVHSEEPEHSYHDKTTPLCLRIATKFAL